MNKFIKLMALGVLVTVSHGILAQQAPPAALQNVVQLSASAAIEVQQDLLSIFLSTTREGNDAAAVQSQLKAVIDAALTEARNLAVAGQLDVRTGNFSLSPRYGRDGKQIGWQGSAELVLEGHDFARISGAAGRIQTLTVSGVSFGLSRDQRAKVEGEAQALAITRFRGRATDIARSFGFAGYSLREVNVSSNDQGVSPRPRMLAMAAPAMAADAPVPVEAGKTSVVVTVSGSVQLK